MRAVPWHRTDNWPVGLRLFIHWLSKRTTKFLSPIFVVLAGVAALFQARAATPRLLPRAMSNCLVLPQWPLRARRSELIRSTKALPIPNRVVAPVAAPESEQAIGARRDLPPVTDRQHFRRCSNQAQNF